MFANSEHKNINKLSEGMSDSERYELLKERTIIIPGFDTEKLNNTGTNDYAALEHTGKSGAYKLLRRIGEEFGIFRNDYETQDVDFKFAFSKGGLHESVYKQNDRYQTYAKMLTVFEAVIINAIGIEVHNDRYENTRSSFDSMYIFVSAFYNEHGIVPVLLEVKTYTDDTLSSLYVAVSLHEIERSRIVGYTRDADSIMSYPIPASINLNLTELLSNVNASDTNLLKYIPDGFLNSAQISAKRNALKETADYANRKNRHRTGNTDDDNSIVCEPDIDYFKDECSIVFILSKKAVNKRCYIMGAGEFDVNTLPKPDDFIIAADGGYSVLSSLGIKPDLVIGDFDSLGKIPDHPNILRSSTVKDDTDMMLAVKYGLEHGYKDFILNGGLGGRIDQTYANIQILTYLSENNARGTLVGKLLYITAVRNNKLIITSDGVHEKTVSVFSHNETSAGVTLKGFKYLLEDSTITNIFPIGVSNVLTEDIAEIEVKNGTLIIMVFYQ